MRDTLQYVYRFSEHLPVSTNSGTITVAPVSTIAGFVAPCAVSPLNPGSVSVISSSTNSGGSTENTFPLWEQILTVSFSFTNFSASPTTSAVQCDLIICLHIHKVVQISILIQILHVLSVNMSFREFLCRTECSSLQLRH